jgi:hypothetical protein
LIGVGLLVAAVLRITSPGAAPPLFDGVVVVEPYVWLDPPPGELGGAKGTSARVGVAAGRSDIIAVATSEQPPQAQVLADPGALTLGKGATSLTVSITPVEPIEPVSDGYIDGNVYRIEIGDQLGRPATAPASAYVSIIVRAADPTDTDATIERFDGASWTKLDTSPNGDSGFLAVVTEFGDFAVVGHGASPYPTPTPAPTAEPSPSLLQTSGAGATATSEAATPAPSGLPGSPTGFEPGWFIVALAVVGLALVASLILILWLKRKRERDEW